MELSIKRKWLSIALLAVVVPMGLLVTFRLTGVLPEPANPEVITSKAVMWETDRPSDDINCYERIENTYADNVASMKVSVPYFHYTQGGGLPFVDREGLSFDVHVNASVTKGFVFSMLVRFHEMDSEAILFVHDGFLRRFVENSNVTITRARYNSINSSEAYVEVRASASPCSLMIPSHWVFKDKEGGHQITITSEILYYNGTTYRKIVLPLGLNITPDVGDTFQTAKQVTTGEYLACLGERNFVDMYTLDLQKGQTINVTMIPPQDSNFDLYLYSPEGLQIVNSTQGGNAIESLTFTANSTGDWYIKVLRAGFGWKGVYKLKIEVLEAKP